MQQILEFQTVLKFSMVLKIFLPFIAKAKQSAFYVSLDKNVSERNNVGTHKHNSMLHIIYRILFFFRERFEENTLLV